MIRPLTLLSIVAAAGAGLHVYNTKHAVSLLDRELRSIAQGIQEAETRTQALNAEWAWATEQERLRGLAQRHLALEPMQPAQFVRFAEAERRLPPPAAHDGPVAFFAPRETTATESKARIALLAPEAAPSRAPAPAAAPLSTPTLTAVAQAALAAATALPLPAPAAPDPRPVARSTVALALPPIARPAVEHRPAEARAPETRPSAAVVEPAARIAPPPFRPAPATPRFTAAPPRPAQEMAQPPAAPRPPTHVAVASVAQRAPEAAATSLGSFGSALGGGSALGSARAALPPPVAFR